jgi:hypothetical protein
MNETSSAPPRIDNSLTKTWHLLTVPFVAVTKAVVGVLAEIAQEARVRPMTWSAILMLAGVMSFMANQYHLGATFISCLGMLWMWQDMIGEPLEEVIEPDATLV